MYFPLLNSRDRVRISYLVVTFPVILIANNFQRIEKTSISLYLGPHVIKFLIIFFQNIHSFNGFLNYKSNITLILKQ